VLAGLASNSTCVFADAGIGSATTASH